MILLIVDIVSAPGKRSALVEMLHELLGDGPPGLLQYAIGLGTDRDAIALIEEWQDAESHAAFMKTDTFASHVEHSKPFLAAPPSSRQFEIDVPNKTTISLI